MVLVPAAVAVASCRARMAAAPPPVCLQGGCYPSFCLSKAHTRKHTFPVLPSQHCYSQPALCTNPYTIYSLDGLGESGVLADGRLELSCWVVVAIDVQHTCVLCQGREPCALQWHLRGFTLPIVWNARVQVSSRWWCCTKVVVQLGDWQMPNVWQCSGHCFGQL